MQKKLSKWLSSSALLAALLFAAPSGAAIDVGEEVMNFALLDVDGRHTELRRTDAKVVALYFTSNGCPIARQSYRKLRQLRDKYSEQGLAVWLVNSTIADTREEIRREVREFGGHSLPALVDDAQGLAQALDVKRTGEVVLASAKDWKILYRGAIDDQLTEGAKKPEPTVQYLDKALSEHFAGKPIETPKSTPHGCLITFEAVAKSTDGAVSYEHVAPIFIKKCADCHSPGNIGPWSMTSGYRKVKSMSAMIQETILSRRMPPWDADPHVGKFANDRSLTEEEKRMLLTWIEQGAPGPVGEDALAAYKAPVPDWVEGAPDAILKLPKPEIIPATGVVNYRHIRVKSPYTNDVWVKSIEIRPGNLKVVHHVIVRAKFKNAPDDGSGRGVMLAGWAPGAGASKAPPRTGMFLGKDAIFDFEMHYTTMGSEQTDQTQIGIILLDEKPEVPLDGGAIFNTDFSIPPGESNSETFALQAVKKDTLLHALMPHMHVRGAWMKYEALYPNGKRELLLSVPRYDFKWQTGYDLAEPKLLPAGTWLLCTGGFDNSPRNPANPDPKARVHWGDQSWEEMFIGFYNASAPLK